VAIYVNVQNFKMAAVRHFGIYVAHFGTTHNEYLVVFITVQNVVGIASVVLTQKFDILCDWLENAYSHPFGMFLSKNRGKRKLCAFLSF